MITEVKKIFKCEHCRKVYQVESACEYHERFCSKNPSTWRPCYACMYLEKRNVEVWSGVGNPFTGEEMERTVSLWFCSAKNCFVHSPKVAYKGIAFELGDFLNVEMPEMCEQFDKQIDEYNNE